MNTKKVALAVAISSFTLGVSSTTLAESFGDALTGGKANGDIRIRYEGVDQDNALDDASAFTIRTRLGYTTGSFSGITATAEFEDVRVIAGMDDYSVPPTGFQTGEYSVIADPEVTELEQGYLKYSGGGFTAKLGRQVLTLDNHRFVGDVGWRQDRQTFDALSVAYASGDLTVNFAYLDQRERIFGQVADVDSEDILLNVSYKTPFGTVTGYNYMLAVEDVDNSGLDTFGVRFAGSQDKLTYAAEFATQSQETAGDDLKATYMMLEGGYNLGVVSLGLGYEVLGSDDGAYGFSTPLATLHKFNGWADVFLTTPATGLVDLSLSAKGKAGPGSWVVAYHDFSADESTAAVDDLGDEIDLVYSMKFGKMYNTGVKAAIYSAGDAGVDTTKYWLWVGATF